jgi:hypothetical protein
MEKNPMQAKQKRKKTECGVGVQPVFKGGLNLQSD